jgi:putative FmdB family regulatory protein
MPTYQYACTDAECGNRFELVQAFSDPAASECPVCSGPVRKVFSAVGVVFKGSGFYRTDSRSNGKSGGDKPAGEAAPAAKESSKAESPGKSESSPSSSSSGPASTKSGSGSAGKVAASA